MIAAEAASAMITCSTRRCAYTQLPTRPVVTPCCSALCRRPATAVGVEPAQPPGRLERPGEPRDDRDGDGQHHTDDGRVLHGRSRGVVQEGRDAGGTVAGGTAVSRTVRPMLNPSTSRSMDRPSPAAAQTNATLRRRATRTPAVRKISATQGSQPPIATTPDSRPGPSESDPTGRSGWCGPPAVSGRRSTGPGRAERL